MYLGANPELHREFILKRLGKKRYQSLMLRANTPTKIDYAMVKLFLDSA